MLELRALTKRFEDSTAVKGLTLQVPTGTLVALLGPSGCGKTTTLRMIAGLTAPTSGEVSIDGVDIAPVPPEDRNIGMVFQRYVLFPHMNVERNVGFGLRVRGVAAAEIARRTAEILEVVQLTGLEKRFPSQLSGGQQQRVAIARTLITQPQLLLMDEPLSNLDAKLREEMRVFIRQVQRRLGITTVFVTHDQVEAMELADVVGVMFRGELIQFDAPETLFARPRTRELAEFLGAMNFFDGTIHQTPAGAVLRTAVGELVLDPAYTNRIGAMVTATIRPEHVAMCAAAAAAAGQTNEVMGTITRRVFFGGSLAYDVQVNTNIIRVEEMSSRSWKEGDPVALTLAPEHVWIFPDAASDGTTP